MRGFQERWFVLDRGVLSYYRNKEEMKHTCRGTLVLKDAKVEVETGNNFIVYVGDPKKVGQCFQLRAHSEKERQEWITALELAKTASLNRTQQLSVRGKGEKDKERDRASLHPSVTSDTGVSPTPSTAAAQPALPAGLDDEMSESEEEGEGFSDPLSGGGMLRIKIAEEQRCHEQVMISLDSLTTHIKESHHLSHNVELQSDVTAIKQGIAFLFSASNEIVAEATNQHEQMSRALMNKDMRIKELEGALKSLAFEHVRLERNSIKAQKKGALLTAEEFEASSGDEDEFFDAEEEEGSAHPSTTTTITTTAATTAATTSTSTPALPAAAAAGHALSDVSVVHVPLPGQSGAVAAAAAGAATFVRRARIPFRPNVKLSLWTVMKNSIGKDLSKIPMPVHFNEPLSFTQRLVEDLEYSALLDKAVKTSNPYERMALVAAFTVSSFASVTMRAYKPFNPLLGETFELDRTADLGWRALLEQVSHHPPICSLHSEGRGWTFWQEFSMNSKFRGKYLEIIPTGISHLLFAETGDHYTWTKVPTTIHNIIVGKLWCDQHGEMDIVNHATGDVCRLKYTAYSYFSSSEARKVSGAVMDRNERVQKNVDGTWDNALFVSDFGDPEKKRLLWKKEEPVEDAEKMYGFTRLAMTLNEFSPTDQGCAPTDSRFRPDKNIMETGDFDRANQMKEQLEEAQRARRRLMEKQGKHWEPVFFKQVPDPIHPDRVVHTYKGGYWEAKAAGSWGKFHLTNIYDV